MKTILKKLLLATCSLLMIACVPILPKDAILIEKKIQTYPKKLHSRVIHYGTSTVVSAYTYIPDPTYHLIVKDKQGILHNIKTDKESYESCEIGKVVTYK